VSVTQLQSNYPFHSPLLAGASRAFRIALRGHRFANPQYPVMIGTDLSWVGSETDVTDAMARQLVTPLNFVALVGRYVADGYTRLVKGGGAPIVRKVIARVRKSASAPHQEWAPSPAASDINERLAAIEREMAGGPAASPAPSAQPVSPAPSSRVTPAAPV